MDQDQNNKLPQEKSVEGEIISKESLSKSTGKEIFINTLNIFASPRAQTLFKPFKHHYHRHYHKHFPRHHKKIFIFDLALVAAIFALGALAAYYFSQKPTFQPLAISIAPKNQKIIMGSEHVWQLKVANASKRPLRAITTTLTFPASFIITAPSDANSSSTSTPQTRVWQIGALSAKENTLLEVRGMVLSPLEERIKIIARTEGFTNNQESFSETNVLVVQATDPALATTISIPQSALTGESFPLIIHYTNQSSLTLKNPIVRFELPSSFLLNNKPSSWQDQSITLPTLTPDARGSLELNGTLSADPRAASVSITLHTSAEINGRRVTQEDLLSSLIIKPTGVKVSLKSLEANGIPGAPLHLTVSLDHTGSETFQTVSVCVPLSLQSINKESIKGEGILIDNQYCLTPAEQHELEEIKNGFHGEWPITFSLQNSTAGAESDTHKNAILALTPRAVLSLPNITPRVKLFLSGSELRIPLTTTLALSAMGRYFTNEGDQLGRGPLPPQAGKTTKYWIGWALRSSTNAIKTIVLRAILPASIQWSGKSMVNKGKNMIYDPATREVRWTHDLLEPTSDECACAEGGFEVLLTPLIEDIGTTPTLVKDISLDGIDIWTETPVRATVKDITTKLEDDALARGHERVQK